MLADQMDRIITMAAVTLFHPCRCVLLPPKQQPYLPSAHHVMPVEAQSI